MNRCPQTGKDVVFVTKRVSLLSKLLYDYLIHRLVCQKFKKKKK